MMNDPHLQTSSSSDDGVDILDVLDARLTKALERAPSIPIPEGFASRFADLTSARPTPALLPSRFGRYGLFAAMAILALIMFALAPAAFRNPTLPLALELTFAAEFAALTIYVSFQSTILH